VLKLDLGSDGSAWLLLVGGVVAVVTIRRMTLCAPRYGDQSQDQCGKKPTRSEPHIQDQPIRLYSISGFLTAARLTSINQM
jgi:hypothetical protein